MKHKMFLESKKGFFGESKDGLNAFGGQYMPEILYSALKELEKAYKNILKTRDFKQELSLLYRDFVGRPTPLIYAKNVSKLLHNEIYLKFEGLANTGAHKINNAIGQVLLAKKNGQDAHYSRNRSGTTRISHRSGVCKTWYGMRGVYGCAGY